MMAKQPNRAGIETLINQAVGRHGFVLFYEINHGAWIRKFPSSPSTTTVDNDNDEVDIDIISKKSPNYGRSLHRFIFGNPLIAITMIREDVEAGLHVPIELLLVETADGGTRCVAQLPSGLIAGHGGAARNEKLVEAVRVLDGKLIKLVGDLMA